MSEISFETLPPVLHDVIADVTPFFEQLDAGRFAVGLGGSLSKRMWDERSDIDFRLYHERPLPRPSAASSTWRDYFIIVNRWAQQGVRLDGLWSRTIAEVDEKLDAWLNGDIEPEPILWTIWGYHILPDISLQIAVLDSYGIISSWHERLTTYPGQLREAILAKHLPSLRYWRGDYHYRHKVDRRDAVFLAALSSRLVHDIIQTLCAINRTPFPGDGNNLRVVESLPVQPDRFRERVTSVLYPAPGETMLGDQYETLLALIDDIEALVVTHH